jgi:CheY-like chemotaxis protein
MSMAARKLRHVACVDDDADILMITRFALEEVSGLIVTDFHGPRAALEGLATVKPDLILMDVMMPSMDGPTTMKKLREQEGLRQTPIVFMTARVQPHELKEYLALGAAGVICKPYDPLTLADSLEDIWRKHSEAAVIA